MLTAMLLAAGKGKRLLPFTRHTPKPLMSLQKDSDSEKNISLSKKHNTIVAAPTLIERQIKLLKYAGFSTIIINLHHLGDLIKQYLGDGESLGVKIKYSYEPVLLDTAGGIAAALPLIGKQPFAVVSADIVCDYDFNNLAHICQEMQYLNSAFSAHLVLGNNPAHHQVGDFNVNVESFAVVQDKTADTFRATFLGMGVFKPSIFADIPVGKAQSLRPILDKAIAKKQVCANWHDGVYFDCGTILRLNEARAWYQLI